MLHVTNGDHAAARIRTAFPAAEVLPWRDMLHDGPVPAGLRHAALSNVRAAFLAAETGQPPDELHVSFAARDGRIGAAIRGREPLCLWFEHDLYDQLQLLQVLSLLPGDAGPVTLVQADDYLGTLDAPALQRLSEAGRPVTSDQLRLANTAWAAFRQPTPEGAAALLDHDLRALAYLRAAILRLLEELPAPGDGLTRTERTALSLLHEGPLPPGELFRRYGASEPAIWLGDLPFACRLQRLGHLLVQRDGQYHLEPAGRDVLAGRADRLALAPIDRWWGGTHLHPGQVWRWDGRSLRRD